MLVQRVLVAASSDQHIAHARMSMIRSEMERLHARTHALMRACTQTSAQICEPKLSQPRRHHSHTHARAFTHARTCGTRTHTCARTHRRTQTHDVQDDRGRQMRALVDRYHAQMSELSLRVLQVTFGRPRPCLPRAAAD